MWFLGRKIATETPGVSQKYPQVPYKLYPFDGGTQPAVVF